MLMDKKVQEYLYIDSDDALEQFRTENQGIEWLGIDTEFVGERRFVTLLCLVQVVTKNGLYIIDALNVDNLTPLLDFLVDESVLKISHAGENDYRLFNQLFGIIPKNIFDTQIAAGFLNYNYPISFSKLVGKELNVRVKKGYTVSDWESRPIAPKQLKYALDDVLYLEQLWNNLRGKLEKLGRESWAKEEFEKLENPAYYVKDPNKEALNSSLMRGVPLQEKAFLLRIYKWRTAEAKRKNYSKDMVLPNKHIAFIVRNINSGRNAAKVNRRIPNKVIQQHWSTFSQLYGKKVTDEEHATLKKFTNMQELDFVTETMLEMIYLIVKYRCHKEGVAPGLVFSRTIFNKMKESNDYVDASLETGWRKDLLGDLLTDWLKNRDQLELIVEENRYVMKKAEK